MTLPQFLRFHMVLVDRSNSFSYKMKYSSVRDHLTDGIPNPLQFLVPSLLIIYGAITKAAINTIPR